jgi:hypothetical protein
MCNKRGLGEERKHIETINTGTGGGGDGGRGRREKRIGGVRC